MNNANTYDSAALWTTFWDTFHKTDNIFRVVKHEEWTEEDSEPFWSYRDETVGMRINGYHNFFTGDVLSRVVIYAADALLDECGEIREEYFKSSIKNELDDCDPKDRIDQVRNILKYFHHESFNHDVNEVKFLKLRKYRKLKGDFYLVEYSWEFQASAFVKGWRR